MNKENEILLYHFCSKSDWNDHRTGNVYKPESLDSEGFIHLSKKEQLFKTFNRYFGDTGETLLLRIKMQEDADALRFEDSYGKGESFPHYYAPLPLEMVQEVLPVPPPTPGGAPEYEHVLITFFDQL